MALVYRLICQPTGMEYIGYTARPLRVRWNQHKTTARIGRENGRLQNALRVYGPEAFDVHVVADGLSEEAALQLERILILSWGTLSPGGLNLTTGGDRVEFTDEAKQKIKAKMAVRTRTEAEKENNRTAKNANRRGKEAQLLALLASGLDQQEVASALVVSQATVSRWAAKAHARNPRAATRARLLPEARQLRVIGWSQQRIADHLGVSQMTISKWLALAP